MTSHDAPAPTSPGVTLHAHDNALLINAFLAWKMAGGAARSSLKIRRSHLMALADRGSLRHITEADCIQLLTERARLAPESRRGLVTSWRTFYRWAVVRGYVKEDPTVNLAAIRVPPGMPRPIPEATLARCVRDADGETRLMLLLGAYAGLRRAEIANVHSDDVEGRWLRVTGKGNKVRRVPIHDALAGELSRVHGWAFPSPVFEGRPVTADYVSDRLSRVLPPPYTPHSLRHRFATMAYRGTHDLRSVSLLLGHAKPETTVRYTLIDDDELTAAVNSIAA